MINTNFLIIGYLVSLSVDWICQSSWQALNKSRWGIADNKITSFIAVASHSSLYAFLTTFITAILLESYNQLSTIFIVLFITHALIDTRIPVKYILKLKGMTDDEILDYKNFGFMHIGIDQRLHEIVLIILSLFV